MNQSSFATILFKTTSVHVVTHFIIGMLSFVFLDYTAKYSDPTVAGFVRQTDHPLVMAGPFFQILRGLLVGIVFYLLEPRLVPLKG